MFTHFQTWAERRVTRSFTLVLKLLLHPNSSKQKRKSLVTRYSKEGRSCIMYGWNSLKLIQQFINRSLIIAQKTRRLITPEVHNLLCRQELKAKKIVVHLSNRTFYSFFSCLPVEYFYFVVWQTSKTLLVDHVLICLKFQATFSTTRVCNYRQRSQNTLQ